MASAIIHLAVAKELEKYFPISNKKDYYLGSIAPDIAKEIHISRNTTHFIDKYPDTPNLENFISKYPNFKNNSFELGYFIHLYTDKLWFNNFIDNLCQGDYVKLLDGTIIKTTKDEINKLIYQDYTNTNIQVIEEYNLDLSLFYEEFTPPTSNITEVPLTKLNILIAKMGIIIENSKKNKNYIFDIYPLKSFITTTTQEISTYLKAY